MKEYIKPYQGPFTLKESEKLAEELRSVKWILDARIKQRRKEINEYDVYIKTK